jgi:type II secretory ATPase GspE/PulE/Tfp pilus assembly ATPase PilB-like protein
MGSMSQNARFDEEQATQRRARILGMSYVDTSRPMERPLYKDLLPITELSAVKVVPLRSDAHSILFGVTNTTSHQAMTGLRNRFLDQQVSFALISDSGFREYMRLYNPPPTIVYQDIQLTNAGKDDLVAQVSATLEQVRADDMLAYLVQQAHKLAASDIHIENQKDYARIRFRIDGVLHPIARLSPDKNRILLSAIASAANISTASMDAQQGHIAQAVKMAEGSQVEINLRVETVSAVNGIDIVMRLFNMGQDMYSLDRLGLAPAERTVVDDIVDKPSGLVLAVGPTGSGKTTTLYSILNSLNTQERKIITVEDPVEYQFEGITQISVATQTSKETSFADKLRAVLRLDPDVVMVGEIRDLDTAKTALQASLTGHLVLSTFHASSASAALTRLMDVIGENPLFVSAIRLIMAQRLVRRLDDATKQPYHPDEATKQQLQQIIDTFPEGQDKPNLDNIQLFKPGSSQANPYGFSGQIALREQLLMAGMIEHLLQQPGRQLPTAEIEEAAIKSGMTTILHDGIQKVIEGSTTLEEVYRVVG